MEKQFQKRMDNNKEKSLHNKNNSFRKPNPRGIALKLLNKVATNEAYSNILLDEELSKYNLDKRDKGLITKLFYGTITYQITLDYIISKRSSVTLDKLSPWILCILRMGIYQIIYLDKIPKHAIVNESVELAKKFSNKGASGLVNALLKNIEKDELCKYKFEDKIEELSVITSHERWFIELLLKEYSFEEVKKICEYNNIEPPVYVRVNILKISKNDLIKEFQNIEIEAKSTDIENVLEISKISDVSNNDLFRKGYYTIQDASATLVGHIVSPKENEIVLDLCSAPGGKTTHLAELMNNTGKIIACDFYISRLKLVNEAQKRLGITNIVTKPNDGTKLNNEFIDTFDKVLLDVPCSGFGVIRRKVDMKYQRIADDIGRIAKTQYAILTNASKYVKKGGYIVYSTCTILKKENEDTIEKFLKENTNFEVVDISKEIKNNCNKDKFIRTLPSVQNYDGFFIAKLRRKE